MAGFGAVDPRTLIKWGIPADGWSGLMANVLLSNVAQLVLSLIYVNYNALLTSLLLAREWNRYAFVRKGLRVSHNPRGAQKSTYFLQLPYRYAVPFIVSSGLMHWLVSQSMYLVSILAYRSAAELSGDSPDFFSVEPDPQGNIQTCGYSPVGIVGSVTLGSAVLVSIVLLGRRRFSAGIPLAGSCSAAISAVCHAAGDEPHDGFLKPLKWGVVGKPSLGVEHCTFSSREVRFPEREHIYVGKQERL